MFANPLTERKTGEGCLEVSSDAPHDSLARTWLPSATVFMALANWGDEATVPIFLPGV